MERKPISNCWYSEVCNRKEESCELSCLRFKEMSYLMESSGVPKPLQFPKKLEAGVDYEQFVELNSIKNDICNMVDNGYNLYLHSIETGNGKTSWAIKIMLKYFNEIWAGNGFRTRALFVHVPTLLIDLKNFNHPISQEYKEALLSVDLVIRKCPAEFGSARHILKRQSYPRIIEGSVAATNGPSIVRLALN